MRTYIPILLAAAACLPQVANAATVIKAPVPLTFVSGTTGVFSATTTTGTEPTGYFVDTYTFTTTELSTFSGSLTTQRLRNAAGTIVSNLDFVSASLDGTISFTDLLTGDAFEQLRLASTTIGSGAHTLLVSYNVSAASVVNAASYAGQFNLGAGAVPEAATWAMFIGGFGMIGAGLRRRKTTYSFA